MHMLDCVSDLYGYGGGCGGGNTIVKKSGCAGSGCGDVVDSRYAVYW